MNKLWLTLCLLVCAPAWADWAAVCAQTGVFVCDDFSDPDDLDGVISPSPSGSPTVSAGMLRFRMPSTSGAAASGAYNLWDWPAVGEGESVYLAYRIRADSVALLSNKLAAPFNWPAQKHFTMYRGSSSCTDLELVVGQRSNGYFWPTSNCGAISYTLPHESNPSDNYFNYGGYSCKRSEWIADSGPDCPKSLPDTWDDFYIEVTIGTYGEADSTFNFWHRHAPSGTWRKFIERTDAVLNGDGVGFHRVNVNAYMTGKKTFMHVPGHVDYDHFVMSTSPLDKSLFDDLTPPAADGYPDDLPAWRQAMTNKTWAEVGNTIEDVAAEENPLVNPNHPSNSPWRGGTGPAGMITAWNGLGYRYDKDEFFGFMLGGHADYGGNEGYRIVLSADSPAWEMVGYPTGAVGETALDYDLTNWWLYTDGRPRTLHTAGHHVFSPPGERYLIIDGNSPWNHSETIPSRRVWSLNFTTGEYTLHATNANQSGSGHGSSVYDSADSVVWSQASGTPGPRLTMYDPADNSWVQKSTHGVEGVLVIAEDRDLMLLFHRYDKFFRVVPKTASRTLGTVYIPANVTGEIPDDSTMNWAGAAYLPRSRQFIVWSQKGVNVPTTDFYVLTPPEDEDYQNGEWVWTVLEAGASNTVTPPAYAGSGGIYGRFRWSENLEAALLVNAWDQPVYAFAIDDGLITGDVTPDPVPRCARVCLGSACARVCD